jgi:hypothetical protein
MPFFQSAYEEYLNDGESTPVLLTPPHPAALSLDAVRAVSWIAPEGDDIGLGPFLWLAIALIALVLLMSVEALINPHKSPTHPRPSSPPPAAPHYPLAES